MSNLKWRWLIPFAVGYAAAMMVIGATVWEAIRD